MAIVRDNEQRATAAAIVEVQLRADPDKRVSWPVYITTLRAKLRCPVTLLVLTTQAAVSRWAREPIDLGHPGFCLAPIVIELADIPHVLEPPISPQLALLSVLAHPDVETARAAVRVIDEMPVGTQGLYLDVLLRALPEAVRRTLEIGMDLDKYEYKSDFARKYIAMGREEGREEGREQARELAREQARELMCPVAIELARSKGHELSGEELATLREINDDRFKHLMLALVGAATSSEVAAAFRKA